MLGDVANVKALALQLRGRFPVDYYTVFSELEAQLKFEFDFRARLSGHDGLSIDTVCFCALRCVLVMW